MMTVVPQPAVARTQARRARSSFYELVTKFPAIAFMAACVLLLDIVIVPDRFADYYQYLAITDGLYYFYSGSWVGFEAASNLLFLSLRLLTGNTITAVNLAHYILGASYVYFYYLVTRDEQVGWRGVLLTFGLFGPLLAFVTIRATPAYLLVSLAALQASRGRMSAIWLTLVATLFHVSAVLAIVPIALGVAQNRLRALDWITGSTRGLAAVVSVAVLLFGLLRAVFNSALNAVIASIPFLNKYIVYTAALDPLKDNGAGRNSSINHLIYMVVMSLFVLVSLFLREERCRRIRAYVLSSYAIFLLLQFSPVTAFRQSQFWAIPLMLVFPWHRYAPGGMRAILFAVVCVGLFALNMPGVYG